LVFLAYQILIDFVNIFPFNDIASRDKRLRKFEVLGNYPPLLIIAFCFFYDSTVSVWIGFILTGIIFVMHLFAWWIPYFFGIPKSVKKDYDKYFTRTLKCLPKIKDHLIQGHGTLRGGDSARHMSDLSNHAFNTMIPASSGSCFKSWCRQCRNGLG